MSNRPAAEDLRPAVVPLASWYPDVLTTRHLQVLAELHGSSLEAELREDGRWFLYGRDSGRSAMLERLREDSREFAYVLRVDGSAPQSADSLDAGVLLGTWSSGAPTPIRILLEGEELDAGLATHLQSLDLDLAIRSARLRKRRVRWDIGEVREFDVLQIESAPGDWFQITLDSDGGVLRRREFFVLPD